MVNHPELNNKSSLELSQQLKELRTKLMETKNAKEVEEIIKEFLKTPKFPP